MDPSEVVEQEPAESGPTYQVLVANEQSILAINEKQVIAAVESVLRESDHESAFVSVAIVDDPTIRKINRQYLKHDYPTDVLSFVLEDDGRRLQGELVVSTDTAIASAGQYGWSASEELLLYLVHGTLHLVGYRDKEPEQIAEMRRAEAVHLRKLGIELPSQEDIPQ